MIDNTSPYNLPWYPKKLLLFGDDPDQTLCTQVYITKSTDYCIASNFWKWYLVWSSMYSLFGNKDVFPVQQLLQQFQFSSKYQFKRVNQKKTSLKKISDKYDLKLLQGFSTDHTKIHLSKQKLAKSNWGRIMDFFRISG